MTKLILGILILCSSSFADNNCSQVYNCIKQPNEDKPLTKLDLNCTLPSPNATMRIMANDVFEADGTTLKKYFETNKTVCAILGWMDDGAFDVDEVGGMVEPYTKDITLKIKSVEGDRKRSGAYGAETLTFDSDPLKPVSGHTAPIRDGWTGQYPPDSIFLDGNEFSKIMKYTVVHEFFHYAQDQVSPKTFGSAESWVKEGTARMFEGIVYDVSSLYSKTAYKNFLKTTYIADTLKDGIVANSKDSEPYKTFAFWKLVRNKCNLDMANMLTTPLPNKNNLIPSNNLTNLTCTKLSNLKGDSLSNLFVYYNWAMLLNNDISKLDGETSSVKFKYTPVQKFSDLNWTKTNPNLHHFRADIQPKNVYDAVIPPYGAKSFKILANTLPKLNKKRYSTDKLKLSIRTNESKISKNLKLVATSGNDKPTNKNSFVLMADESHLFTDKERGNDFFVTLTNTTKRYVTVYRMYFERELMLRTECEKEALRLSEAATDKAVGDIYAKENGCKNPYTETCKTKTQKLLRTKGYAASYAYAKSNGCNDGGNNNDGGDNDGGGNGGPSGPGGDGGPSDPGGPGGDGGSNGGGDGGPSDPGGPGGPGGEDNKTCKDGKYPDGTTCPCENGKYPDGSECPCENGKYPDGSECPCVDGKYPDGTECEEKPPPDCNETNNTALPDGIFTAAIGWGNPYVKGGLSNKLMGNKIEGCGYVAISSGDLTLFEVYPGVYPINGSASVPNDFDENTTVTISFEAKVIDTHLSASFDYKALGHIADIVITRPNAWLEPTLDIIPQFPLGGGNTYGINGGGNSGGYPWIGGIGDYFGGSSFTMPVVQNDPPLCESQYSCGCMPCGYNAFLYLNQQRFGPVSGANYTLYKATEEDDPNREILYSGQTSISNKIDKAGIIYLPVPNPKSTTLTQSEKNFMDDIKNYEGDFILEMSGGLDIDRDDNFVVDSQFTQVNGKAHLILSKEKLLQNDYKVNILTEISYQLSKDLLGENYDKVRLQTRLDDIAQRVLIEKVYPDANQPLGRDDLFYWMPMAFKNWLVKPYDSTLAPIVNKVYAGENIYDEAYNYVYNPLPQVLATVPVLKSHWFKVVKPRLTPHHIYLTPILSGSFGF